MGYVHYTDRKIFKPRWWDKQPRATFIVLGITFACIILLMVLGWHFLKQIKNKPIMEYTEEIGDIGDLFTVRQWKRDVKNGCLVDYDGFGSPVKGGKCAKNFYLYPSEIDLLPKDATHVLWFNR